MKKSIKTKNSAVQDEPCDNAVRYEEEHKGVLLAPLGNYHRPPYELYGAAT